MSNKRQPNGKGRQWSRRTHLHRAQRLCNVGGFEQLENRLLLAADVPDQFEPNDTFDTATVLGSGLVIKLRDLSIHQGADGIANSDFYQTTASRTGMLIVNVYFNHADGDLKLVLRDHRGTIVGTSNTVTDNERLVIPVVGEEVYVVEVLAGTGSANMYSLELENFAAPAPQSVHLDSASDTGMMQNDSVTADTSPRFIVQADLSKFRSYGVSILTADEANTAVPGAAVLAFITDVATGVTTTEYANVLDENSELYTFTPSDLPSADYVVSAAIQVSDARVSINPIDGPDPVRGRSNLSPTLQVTIDAERPLITSPQLIPSSDSGMSRQDHVTNIIQPAFLGISESNAKIRVLANGLLVGETTAGSDGRWEITVEPLTDGIYFVTAQAEDLAGNFNENANIVTFEVDTIAPNTPHLDLVAASDTGVSDTDNITDQSNLTFTMTTTDANSADHLDPFNFKYRLYLRGEGQGEVLIYNSADDITIPDENRQGGFTNLEFLERTFGPLPEGSHNFKLEVEDRAGNISNDVTLNVEIGIDKMVPEVVESNGPRIENVTQADDEFTSLFDPTGGVDPLITSIVVHFSDTVEEGTETPPSGAVKPESAMEEGNYILVGDANGHIPIVGVSILAEDDQQTGVVRTTVQLTFAAALPDDRYTFTVSDHVTDLAGNALDGESGAVAPFEGNAGRTSVPPIFPTGDGHPGGNFQARFTIDSRPEIAVWAAGSVWVDTNGNFTFDATNIDFVNRDVVYTLGFTSDDIFAGNFAGDGDADGFDKLAAYGRVDGRFRWLIDVDNDGVADIDSIDPMNVNGLPVAGRFDSNDENGDEVGIYTGSTWYFDTDHDFQVDVRLHSNLRGYPIVGDFDGDGFDDLGAWSDDQFQIDLAGGVRRGWDGTADVTFRFGFIGVRERPVAADMDQDGFEDIGLWTPDRASITPGDASEWYWLVSGGSSVLDRLAQALDPVRSQREVSFKPMPFGDDIFAQFGNDFALPVVGNFDPPVLPRLSTKVEDRDLANPRNPLDVSGDGEITPQDALLVINYINEFGTTNANEAPRNGPALDVNDDGFISPRDALIVINELNRVPAGEPDPLVGSLLEGDESIALIAADIASALVDDDDPLLRRLDS